MAAKRSRLIQRRKVVGLSQEALAGALRVERSTVVRWERGETEPQPWIRPRLATALQVSLDELNELLARPGPERSAADPAGRPVPEASPPLADAGPWRAPARDRVVIWPAGRDAAMPLAPAYAAREAPAVCQLPPSVADFTGREPQITQLTDMLAGHDGERVGVPIAVIAGLPGAGKTALALQVAHRVRDAFPDGQLWVPLDGAGQHPRDPGEVLGEMIRALSVPGSAVPASLSERASLYRSLLAGRRVLVLADDAASAAQVRPLLPGTGHSAVLITSRSDLAGPPGSRLIQLDPLTSAESVQLLARIIGPERVAAEPDAAVALAEASGQLPLAVRITGARLAARGSWQLSSLARKITHARRRLDELENGDMSVRASLTQAYQALEAADQRAFRRLALLDSAEFTEWQVAALLGVDDAAGVVSRLADSSLLTATGIDPADQPRYRPHDLVREYAAERLADEPSGQEAAALRRLTDGWLQLTTCADAGLPREPYFPPPGPTSPTAIIAEPLAKNITADPVAWFSAERLGLLAVIERCCATGRHRAAAQLASLLAAFWHLQGRFDDSERTWRMVATAAEQARDTAATARARLRMAAAACGQGRHVQASPLVDQCLTAFEELGDRRGLAAALYWHASCEWNLRAYADARRSAQRAIRLSQETGDRQAEAMALRLLALASAHMNLPGYAEDAVVAAEKGLSLAREIGEPGLENEVLHSVASVYGVVGRHEDALELCGEGLALAQRLGLQAAIADWLGVRGDAYRGLGRYREAADSLLSALPIFCDHFMHRHHGLCLLKLGYTYQAMGDHQAASRYLEQSLDMFSRLQVAYLAERARDALRTSQEAVSPPAGPAVQPGGGTCR
jgi:tetratricopeptide (TPR) repeat protein/transcriptional regulator with XRE-family HTH domain